MKKLIRVFAIAAIVPMMVCTVATSCKKNNPDKDKEKAEVVLEETTYADFVTAGKVAKYQTTSSRRLVTYDFNGSGTATLGFKIVEEVTAVEVAATKAGSDETPDYYEVHPYTTSGGEGDAVDYNIEGFGTLTIEVTEEAGTGTVTAVVTIKENNQEVVENVPAVVPESAAVTTFSTNICRDWKVKEIFIEGSGDGLKQTIGYRFKGCDLNEMLKFLEGKGVKLNNKQLQYQMNVELIKISKFGEISVKFTETPVVEYQVYPVRESYVVNVNPAYLETADKNLGNILKELAKEVTLKEGSSATITVTAEGTATLKVALDILTKDNKNYKLTVEAILEEIKSNNN